MKPGFVNIGPGGAQSVRSVALAAACAVMLALVSCDLRLGSSVKGKKKGFGQKQSVVEIPETDGILLSGEITGRPSTKLGESLEVWYRDAGDAVVLATRSVGRVLLHVDVNQNGRRDDGLDIIYGPLGGSSVCAQFSRPPGAPMACGEFKTAAGVGLRGSGAMWEESWRLPKTELGSVSASVDLSFEVFDERYQSSAFLPGAPFGAVGRLKPGSPIPGPPLSSKPVLPSVSPPVSPPVLTPAPPSESPLPSTPAPVSSQRSAPVQPPQTARSKPPDIGRPPLTMVEPPEEGAPLPRPQTPRPPVPTEPRYALLVSARGFLLSTGASIPLGDDRLSGLTCTVQYSGPQPAPARVVLVDWLFLSEPDHPEGVRYDFKEFTAQNPKYGTVFAYNNTRITPGKYKVVLRIDGEEWDSVVFEVSVPK